MAIPKNGKKKKSLLKTNKEQKETKVASADNYATFDIYFNKLKAFAQSGGIPEPAQISAYNIFRQDVEEGMKPKDSFNRIMKFHK